MKRETVDRLVTRPVVTLALILGFSLAAIGTARAEPLNGVLPSGAVDKSGGYRGFFLPGIAPITIVTVVECRQGPRLRSHFDDRMDDDCARPKRANGATAPGAALPGADGPQETLRAR